VGLEQGSLSLVNTTEELLGRTSSSSDLENREDSHGDPLCWSSNTLYPQKLALTLPTSGSRSVSIVRLWTKATEFSFISFKYILCGGMMKTGPVRDAPQSKKCVYNIICDCGRCYTGKANRPLQVHITEHKYNLTQGLL
jgi:hypothetical protein